MDLWTRIESVRSRKGLPVDRLAALAGIARGTYYRLREPGHAQVDTVARLAHVLEVDLSELFRDENRAPDPLDVSLARWRDLRRPDGADHPAEFAAAVEMAWRARFQGCPVT